jgi:Zn finger protein HypA/HybF involved in hydrogenase expression
MTTKSIVDIVKIVLTTLQCTRCEHQWFPRTTVSPKVCPKCNSPYWDKPVKYKTVSKIQKERKRD